MNTVVVIHYAQLSQHSEMCFLWSRGALSRQLYSKESILDFLYVQRIASESQLWFQGTIIMFAVVWETSRKEDTSLIDTTSKFSFGMNYVYGSVLKSAFALLLLLWQAVPLRHSSVSALWLQLGCKRWILVFNTDKDSKDWNPLLGFFLMPY